MQKLNILAGLFAVGFIGTVHANETISDSNNQYTFSIGNQNMNYHEHEYIAQLNGADPDSDSGNQTTFRISKTGQSKFLGIEDFYTRYQIDYASGTNQYDGHYNGTFQPGQATSNASTFDASMRVGKGFTFKDYAAFQLTPFAGFGMHLWHRQVGSNELNNEAYGHLFWELGTMAQYAVNDKLVLSTDIAFGKTVAPTMVVAGTTFHLGSSSTINFGLGADYKLNKNWHVNGRYEYSTFKYGISETHNVDGYAIHEPNSDTTIQKIYVGVGYSF
ncbi:outer membrane protein [Aquitalea magnusonii]|uniref:Outer membrane protein with beta-barrel domain n=1 Tax=Aquitalea magnusonii TaxID=332411 RepID=A0A318J8S9_9NEIS|nr:outer membrane beta-barrel protein [Aquitalea magnusonii]PXX42892.1 outer membrane protein with beta-barrel domain [Aquitalea magnusonii]